jgi:glycosyltransferase involved in cell wall biosynthesis
MLKITHIIGRLAYGGAERLLLEICRKIDESRFDISVIVLQDDNPLAKIYEDAGVAVKFFNKKTKADFRIVKKVADYLRETRPDIVHTQLFAGDYWGGKAALSAKVPHIICTKHDILSEGYLRDRLGKKMRQKFEKVIAISEATREFLIHQEQIDPRKIALIYNGIDANRFFVKGPSIFKRDGLVIGSVGRLSKEKGQKHLIRACRFLKNRDWKLILVGDGPKRPELEALTESIWLSDKVEFIGAVDDVRPYLAKMDIFVLPSVSEGLSLVVLEAAAAAKFIVAANVGGVPEIITDRENGLLFKPKNIEQLLQHLNWADENRERAIKMAERLQNRVLEKFDINKTIKQYERLYENIAGQ